MMVVEGGRAVVVATDEAVTMQGGILWLGLSRGGNGDWVIDV